MKNLKSAMYPANTMPYPTFMGFEEKLAQYDRDQLFGPIIAALEGRWLADAKPRKRLKILLPSFTKSGWRLLYNEKLCIPSHCHREILNLAHDSTAGSHFAFTNTLARLVDFHWKHKVEHVK